MRRDLWKLLIVILLFINMTTVWTYLFREYYRIYYHLQTYYIASLLILIVIILGLLILKDLGISLAGVVGASIFLAVPISFYPNITNNPDVIKMLQLTSLLLRRDFELARHVDYSAFPGFSYIVGIVSVLVKVPLRIELASFLYVLLTIMFLLLLVTLGKSSRWVGVYLLILFSEGFIYSFEYFSPQLFGQILLITALIIMLNTSISPEKGFILFSLVYCGTVVTHPESMLMLLIAFTLYYGRNIFLTGNSKSAPRILTQIAVFLIILTAYSIFFISSFGPSYILKMPLVYLQQIDKIIFHLFKSEGGAVVTSSSIKPLNIHIPSIINILYNAFLLLFAIYLLKKYKREFFGYWILIFSFFISAGVFLLVFGFSFGQFIGRPALAVSLIVGILVARYFSKKDTKIARISSVFFLTVLLLVSFPARVAPQEWNVHVENYYPPIFFIMSNGVREHGGIYYFLYPNINISIKQANYVILPVGQKVYLSGMERYLGWDVDRILHQLSKLNSVVYSNGLSTIVLKNRVINE
ncbi:hypothetical protein [Thermococcus sp. JdF3]|uniref:hypothetical protein n=1 Tax=Thermococcus sp. JdF3 TaxID=1638258 RepID=UPI00143931C1|nr:hypothetical protein [Thermococcus sp. JdF3]NJE00445.1 hypothetical protein [Thermococcus sp. JdF3]